MTLAANAVAIIVPWIKKGAEAYANELIPKISKDAAQATVDIAKNLFNKIKSKFSDDTEAADTIKHFEEKPDRYSSAVKDILKEKLDHDNVFAAEVDDLVKQIDINVIIKMEEGEEVVGLETKRMSSGRASVNMDIKKGKKITGAKIENIGNQQTSNE